MTFAGATGCTCTACQEVLGLLLATLWYYSFFLVLTHHSDTDAVRIIGGNRILVYI